MSNQDFMEESVQELRSVNKLVYLRPDNGSLINKRTYKSYNFTNLKNQPSSTAQMIINSGGDAIYGPSSYLKMKYTITTASGANANPVGTGNVLNFIKSVRLTHRSGEVLEYIQNFNVLAKLKMNYNMNEDSNLLLKSLLSVPGTAGATPETRNTAIPMWMLLGVFSSNEMYIPPGFLAGAKLELELESSEIALVGGATDVYSDVEFQLVLDSSQVFDSAQKQLLDEQADVERSGLQFAYSTYFNTNNQFSGTQVNFDIQQSASVTEKVCMVVRTAADIGDITKDSFIYKPSVSQYQWRLGSHYLPQAPANSDAEAYMQTLVTFDAAPHQYEGGLGGSGVNVSFGTFKDANAGVATYSTTLEKSAAGLIYSGSPTNNSILLSLEASKAAADDRVDVFLKYLRVANIMGDNLVVDR